MDDVESPPPCCNNLRWYSAQPRGSHVRCGMAQLPPMHRPLAWPASIAPTHALTRFAPLERTWAQICAGKGRFLLGPVRRFLSRSGGAPAAQHL